MSVHGNYAFAYDEKGIPTSYQSTQDGVPQGLQRLDENTFRGTGHDGKLTYVTQESPGQISTRIEEIGNLNELSFRSTTPVLRRPSPNDIQFILDREFRSIDYRTSLTNIRATFSVHRNLPNDNFFSNLREWTEIKIEDKLVGKFVDFGTGNSFVSSVVVGGLGIKDSIRTALLGNRSLSNWDRKQILGVYEKFQKYLDADRNIFKPYEHVSIKYNPSRVGQVFDNFAETLFKKIPVLGELNISAPKPGEIVHIIRFETQDSVGFLRQGEFEFTYGPYFTENGRTRYGPMRARLVVYKSRFRLSPTGRFDPEENTGYVPWF